MIHEAVPLRFHVLMRLASSETLDSLCTTDVLGPFPGPHCCLSNMDVYDGSMMIAARQRGKNEIRQMCHHSCKCLIGPSMLASDLSCMADEAKKVLAGGADYLHLDVMDGHFVPNITWGPPVIKCLRKHVPNAFFDCHMMVLKPEQWVNDIADAGGDQFTFHLEATENPEALIEQIRAAKMKVGIALRPGTPVEAVLPYVAVVDMVLVMTVEPGFGGQKFMHDMMSKVSTLRKAYPDKDIEVDGGLGPSTVDAAAAAGANMIVAGSSVFSSPDPAKIILTLRRSVEKLGNGKPEEELTPWPDGMSPP